MAAERDRDGDKVGDERGEPARTERPRKACGQPQRQRGGDEIGGDKDIHRQQEDEPAEPGTRKVSEIDPAEGAIVLEKDRAEEHRAGDERRELGQKHLQELPLLRWIGDEKNGVEAEPLDIKVGRDRERTEETERDRRPRPANDGRTSP